jgi:hypothetical protein
MASLLLSNTLIRRVSPNLLKPVSTTKEGVIGSIGKCVYETVLIKTEFTYYTKLFGSLVFFDVLIPLNDSSLFTTGIIGMTLGSALIVKYPYIIPYIRTGYGIYKKNIHIIKFPI